MRNGDKHALEDGLRPRPGGRDASVRLMSLPLAKFADITTCIKSFTFLLGEGFLDRNASARRNRGRDCGVRRLVEQAVS